MSRTRDRSRSSAGFGFTTWRPADPRPLVAACRDPYIGPHNRCSHPTAQPRGYRRCLGERACPVWINERSRHTLCYEHRRWDIAPTPNDAYRELMGAVQLWQ